MQFRKLEMRLVKISLPKMVIFAITTVLFFSLPGNILSRPDYGFSTYCQPCISPCAKHPEKNYYFCNTYDWTWENKVWTWDYCSLSENSDHIGRNCSSACAYHGEGYQWCTSDEDWGYCSGPFCVSQATELPDYGYSTYCQSCITPCQQTKSQNYWCGTRKWKFDNKTWTWDYCSPNSGVDFQGSRCLGICKFRNGLKYQSCPTEKQGGKGYCTGKGNVLCDFLPKFD
ncbi:hypothetical protein Fcan01_01656 [Folsomia candida]|uniref:Uncharacterized protein n=1 Tax=Folsomia candida TaxID=158441 RepID=A0A226F1V1_FOLCA|nr:hypothetical protein Fcan01_01656 [Folsomia candida]